MNIQYEALLTHLNNSNLYRKLISINTNNISPEVLIDFTHSLLSVSNTKWLLVFDGYNFVEKKLRMPKTKTSKQHVIITTREQKVVGENILFVGPFHNFESAAFLKRIHSNEKKEEIFRLSKILFNYPLALAQVSEEILMYKTSINEYLKKHNILLSLSVVYRNAL